MRDQVPAGPSAPMVADPFAAVHVPKRLPSRKLLTAGDPAAVRHHVVAHVVRLWVDAVARATPDAPAAIEINPTQMLREFGITLDLNREAGYAPITTAVATLKWLGLVQGTAHRSYTRKAVRVYRLTAVSAPVPPCGSGSSTAPLRRINSGADMAANDQRRFSAEKVRAARLTHM